MTKHSIEVSERELRIILTAFDVCRDEAGPLPDHAYRRWTTGSYDDLYVKLRDTGHSCRWHSNLGFGDCEHDGECECAAFSASTTPPEVAPEDDISTIRYALSFIRGSKVWEEASASLVRLASATTKAGQPEPDVHGFNTVTNEDLGGDQGSPSVEEILAEAQALLRRLDPEATLKLVPASATDDLGSSPSSPPEERREEGVEASASPTSASPSGGGSLPDTATQDGSGYSNAHRTARR